MKSLDYQWSRLRAMAWLVLGRQRPAMVIFNHMVARWPDDSYALASRAHQLCLAGQLDEALADSLRLTQLNAGEARVWFNHGFMLETAERWEEALQAFERATEIAPKMDRAWYGMGLVLIRLQRLEQAVAALKRNTELQPMSPFGWYQLARVHADRQESDAALKIIRHLQGFEPKVAAQLARETGLQAGVRPV